MYKNNPVVIFGFHACTKDVAQDLIAGSSEFKPSENRYDWLGHGMYFWEGSRHRAERFAQDRCIEKALVIGAAIHLGYCLDLTDSESLAYLASSYHALSDALEISETPLPVNRSVGGSAADDLLLRYLDCAVINFLHTQRQDHGLKPFDSVRGVFWEGKELYPGAGFKEKNHIQVCVRNPNCIKGFFWPREDDPAFDVV